MSKSSTWLLTFRDGLDSTLSASIRKLESLFADNATWIEDQRRRVRVAKEENERQLKAQQNALTAVDASVKKPRGRSKKAKATIQKAMIDQSSEAWPVSETSFVADENSAPKENNLLIDQAAPTKPKRAPKNTVKKARGRPPKAKPSSDNPIAERDVSSLSGSAENSGIEALGTSSEEEPVPIAVQPRITHVSTPARLSTPVRLASLPTEEKPEPVYILTKPELVIAKGSPITELPATPLKSLSAELELEILNPSDSHSRPRQSLIRVASTKKTHAAPVLPVVAPVIKVEEPKQITPKGITLKISVLSEILVESWTSQFLKAAPVAEPVPVIEEALVVVEPVVIPPPAPLVPKVNPALAHLQAEARPALESPLTRARRIDSQNTWREQQLSKFFVSKTEILKNAMDTLKVVKDEERVSKILSVEERTAKIMSIDEKILRETGTGMTFDPPAVHPEPIQALEPKESPQKQKSAEEAPAILRKSPRKKDVPARMSIFNSPKKRESSYPDIFKVVSPLKTKKDTLVFDSGPASPNFLTTSEAPALDDTVIPDEIVAHTPPEEKLSDVFDSKLIPSKREAIPSISEEERLKRQRLRERQQQAIEKRNMQIKKAQETKARQEEMFNPKPRPPTISVKAVSTAAPMAKNGPRPTNGPTVSGLHKTAIFNASKSNLSNGMSSEKPDFKTPAAKIRSPASLKMAEKVVSSPMFPEIHSDEEDYLRKASETGSRPDWAATPALRTALLEQQNFPTDKIFDKIQPVRLEDIFKNKTFKRGRNSTIPFM